MQGDSGLPPVIVAGGTGFIGAPLCRALAAQGRPVVRLTRRRDGDARPPGGEGLVSGVFWDGRTTQGWGHLAEGAAALINLAGENISGGRWTARRKRRILESRVLAATALAQAAVQAARKPGAFLQGSAVGYYGDTGQEPVDESAPHGKGFLAEVCRQWEEASRCVEDAGVRRLVVRTGVVLGRGGGALEKMLPPFRWFLGGPLGDGRQIMPWIHLQDQVNALLFLLDNKRARGVFNLTAPQAASNLEFSRELGRVLSRPSWLAAPAPVLKLLLGEMAVELLLSGCRAVPARLAEHGFQFSHPELRGALRHLFAQGA